MSAYRGIDHRSALSGTVPSGFGGHAPDNINLLTGKQGIGTGGNSCAPGGISIDQHLAATIGRGTRFASLPFYLNGVRSSEGWAKLKGSTITEPFYGPVKDLADR